MSALHASGSRAAGGLLQRVMQRVWRVAPEDRESIELGHSRIYILPTRRGAAFACTLLLMLLASMNYAMGLGYIFVFLLVGLCVSSLLHTFRNVAGIQVSPGPDPEAFVGDPLAFTLRVGKAHGEPAYSIDLSPRFGGHASAAVPKANTVEVQISIPANERGRIPLGRVTLSSTYPLGLWRAWSYLHFPYSGWAYPAPESNAPPPPQHAHGVGTGTATTTGNEEVSGLRSYQRTDTSRQIAWKALARGMGLHSKDFTGSGGGDLVLRWDDVPHTTDTESALSRLCAWVLAADRAGARFGLSLPGAQVTLGSGRAHRAAALRALAMHGKT